MYFLVMTPIIFTSSIYYPLENLPIIFRGIGILNPLSWFTDIGRHVYLEIYTTNLLPKTCALIALFVIAFIIANNAFDKGLEK